MIPPLDANGNATKIVLKGSSVSAAQISEQDNEFVELNGSSTDLQGLILAVIQKMNAGLQNLNISTLLNIDLPS